MKKKVKRIKRESQLRARVKYLHNFDASLIFKIAAIRPLPGSRWENYESFLFNCSIISRWLREKARGAASARTFESYTGASACGPTL